jgi:hypothetical protein
MHVGLGDSFAPSWLVVCCQLMQVHAMAMMSDVACLSTVTLAFDKCLVH